MEDLMAKKTMQRVFSEDVLREAMVETNAERVHLFSPGKDSQGQLTS